MEQNVQIADGVKGHFELKGGVLMVGVEVGLPFLIQKLDDATPNPLISSVLQVLKSLAEKA